MNEPSNMSTNIPMNVLINIFIISTDEDLDIQIERFAIINKRGVSTSHEMEKCHDMNVGSKYLIIYVVKGNGQAREDIHDHEECYP